MLTVTLVASLAAAMLWQQWRSFEIEAAERQRVQSLWVLTGSLDWVRLILREDARAGGADHLGEPWAVPLEEARLSTFLAAEENSNVDDAGSMQQTFLSGRVNDLQARLNVRNLMVGGKVSDPALAAFSKLFEHLGLPPSELTALTENLLLALNTGTTNPQAPLMPQRFDQLAWLGLSSKSLAVLRPFVTLLPEATPVNLNTASATVLYACIPSLDMAQAQRMVSTRQLSHFRALADASRLLGDITPPLNDGQHTVSSRFFEVLGRLRQDQTVVDELSVLQRDGLDVKTLWRDRGTRALPDSSLQ
jgi:general secretion pathway protein K